ncbi:MFS transporter [Candidatus Nitronereus thalassa]|uniref:MFS transporter n=1 Tax=Candidatus Nitronereus thalassa TaxID=3020898 RepID=A0ABU3K7W5_9BACT|nr:MFS transporter [Candidatus Nitronereus thalassa]MDT7042484.1 MFS transporter [Candidatus Nitronereus thalassa]
MFVAGYSYRWVILVCGVLAYATSYLTRWSYTGLASFIQEDLQLDKADLGVLGSAFFYTYALVQVPWGKSADRWGGRTVIPLGVLLSAGGLLGFTLAQSFGEAIGWRVMIGLVAASVFVPVASLLSHWFASEDRGFANGIYYGFGGGLGQATAFLLLPLLHVFFLDRIDSVFSGWRGAMGLVALIVAGLGVGCWVFLRSYPPQPETKGAVLAPSQSISQTTPNSRVASITKDPILWCLGGYFAAGIIALRLVPGWLTIFASEWYHVEQGYSQTDAVIAGGVMGTVYTIGHVAGSPLLGKLSDRLAAYGIGRFQCAAMVLGLGAVSVSCLTVPMGTPWMLGGVALLLGVTLHAFPIINAAVSDRWGGHRTGHALGWINMVGQLAGAVALSVSGYLGLAWASGATGTVAEYAGIWYLAAGACVFGAGCGWLAHRLTKTVVRIS